MAFQIATLASLLAFYGCYFAKMFAQRRRGIRTDQLGRKKRGFVLFIERGLKFATYLAPAAEVVSVLLNTSRFPGPVRILGCALSFAGVALLAASISAMGDSWRAGVSEEEQTEFVTGGVYRYSRNPAFLGFDLSYIGVLLTFFNWPLLAVSALAGLMLHLQITNVEEDFLIGRYGEKYLQYRKQVRRYFGRKHSVRSARQSARNR